MPICHIMVGLPGTGKRTLVKNLIFGYGGVDRPFVYSTDDYIESVAVRDGKTYDTAFDDYIKEATRVMNTGLDHAVAQGRDIIWDQTNTGIKKRKTIVNRFNEDWEFKCHCILPPQGDSQLEDWKFRLNDRPGKTIPDHIIANMQQHFSVPTLDERFDEVVYYNMYGEEISRVE
jgi:predicted kinase